MMAFAAILNLPLGQNNCFIMLIISFDNTITRNYIWQDVSSCQLSSIKHQLLRWP